MPVKDSLTTARVLAVFSEEVGVRRGKVTDTFDDGKRLFARAVLHHLADVAPGDQLRGGVAIKATQDGVWLYPYTFRLVCGNGAIVAQTLEERPIAEPYLRAPEAVLQAVRAAVEACCNEEIFSSAVGAMRTARDLRATDMLLNVLPMLSHLSDGVQSYMLSRFFARTAPEGRATHPILSGPPSFSQPSPGHTRSPLHNGDLLSGVIDQFQKEGDQSQFGLANAITAVARDVQDPGLKWDLEKLGGAVALGTLHHTTDECEVAATLAVDEELVRTA